MIEEQATTKYFPTDLGLEIWRKKYAGTYDDPLQYYLDMAKRVSLGSAAMEERFRDLLLDFRFSPGGRILAWNGRPNSKVSLMNCTTHAVEGDNLDDIACTAHVIMLASSHGQGIGVDLSKLRPMDAPVDNAAKTSTGAISFMEWLNATGGVIGQNGRRAALLFSMRDNHPDLWRDSIDVVCAKCGGRGCFKCQGKGGYSYDFLNVKRIPGRVENANISVMVTDAFMEAVQQDADWDLEFQGESGNETFHVKRTVRARDLFRALAQGAWASAEPGVLFWDTSARMSNSDLFGEQFKITGVNACQPASATVLTPYGIRTFGDLQVGDNIWGKNGWTRVVRKWSTGIKPVYRFYTSKGVFEGTADHKVFQDGSRVEVQDADSVDGLVGPFAPEYYVYPRSEFDPQDVMDGLVLGDGSYHDRCAYPHLYVGQKDQDYLNSEVSNLFVSSAPAGVDTNASAYYVSTTLVAEDLPKTYERTVPDRYFYGGRAKMSGFLRGLFSANGYVTRVKGKGSRVGLKQSSLEMIKQVQIMLSALGIESYITISKEKLTTFGNGDYIQRESYDLNLSSTEALKFMQTIGFVQDYKNESYVPPAMSKYSHPTKRSGVVQFVEELGEMEVFDITVDDRDHAYWTGGLLVSNCSEQVLDQDGVCNLGSLNLARYVADPFTKNARFNYTQLAWDTASSIHFLDNVLEIELNEDRSITEDQRESVIALRRIGLGVMGLADAIAMMGLKYEANPDTAAFLGTVFRNIRNAAYEKSVKLAQQRGACGVWKDLPVAKRKEVVEQGFYATLPLYHKKEIIKHGLRNAVLLSIAPTGSISNLYGVSSGVEPIFARSYTRMMRISGQDETVEVVHPGVQMSRAAGVDDSVWQTAYEVTPRDHVLIQAMIQPFVDASLSKTVNMPWDATVEDVEAVYMLAWGEGLKGLTVYRDGSRDIQVLTSNDRANGEGIDPNECPNCGGQLVKQEGCESCPTCGHSKC